MEQPVDTDPCPETKGIAASAVVHVHWATVKSEFGGGYLIAGERSAFHRKAARVSQQRMTIDLAPGEQIIWHGQPMQGFRLAPEDAFAVPFAAFWLVMVTTIFGLAFTGEMTEVDPLAYFMMPVFLIFGLYMLFGRFLVDRAARRRIHYYLTTQRAVIESGLLRTNRRSVNLAAAPEIQYRGRRNGRGTVQFASTGLFGMMPRSWPGAGQFLPAAFDDIEDAERIYNLALKAQRDAQAQRR